MKFENGQMQNFICPFFKERGYVVNENKIETKSKTNQNTYHMERNQKAKSSAFLGRSNDDLWSDFLLSSLSRMDDGIPEL